VSEGGKGNSSPADPSALTRNYSESNNCENDQYSDRRSAPDTPWGFADAAEEIAPGIVFYSTPSHGGYHLSLDRLASVATSHRAYAAKWSKGWGEAWYEEDCAAAIVVVTFPQFFAKDARKFARRVVDRVIDTLR
jgi:hypothetical protein